jgi:hypothetical protein
MANPFDDIEGIGAVAVEDNPFDDSPVPVARADNPFNDVVDIPGLSFTDPDIPEKGFLTKEGFLPEDGAPKINLKPVEPTLPQYIRYKLTMDRAGSDRSRFGAAAMWGRIETPFAQVEGNRIRDYWIEQAGPYQDLSFKEAPVKFALGEAAQLLPYMVTSQIEGAKYGLGTALGFAGITAAAGQAGPQVSVPEEIITVPAAAAAGFKVGWTYGVIKNVIDREGGGLYLDMVEKGISEKTARPLALAGSTVIGITEVLQFKTLSKPLKQAYAKVLRTSGGQRAITSALLRYIKTVGVEVSQEELQEITSLTTETIAGMIDEKPDAKPTKEEWKTRLLETAKKAGTGLAVISIPGSVIDVATSVKPSAGVTNETDVAAIDNILAEEKGEEVGGAAEAPVAEEGKVIIEGQEFVEEIDPETGKRVFVEAPAVVVTPEAEVLTDEQIQTLSKSGIEEVDAAIIEVAKTPGADLDVLEKTLKGDIIGNMVAQIPGQKPNIKGALTKLENVKGAITRNDINDVGIYNVFEFKEAKPEISEAEARESIKDVQIKGRLTRLDEEFNNIQKEIDQASKDLTALEKSGKPTKATENKLTKLQRQLDVIDSERGELLTTAKADIALRKEKVTLTAEELATREIKAFKANIAALQKGFKEGKIATKKDIKESQDVAIRLIESSVLEANDKAKFIKFIKNIDSHEKLIKNIPELLTRINILESKAEARSLNKKIRSEIKKTKPLKKGQRRIGRYDYESNKLFETLRAYNKMTKEQALNELNSFPEEIDNEADLIKARLLSLKALGATASVEIHQKVLDDIIELKQLGAAAKDDLSFERALERQERIDEALAATAKIRANKKTITTKIGNAYRKGFSNIHSMLNSMFGKDFANQYDPEISENRRDTAVYLKTKAMINEAIKIYGNKHVLSLFDRMGRKDYSITDLEGLTSEITKLELIDIYNSIKNKQLKKRYYDSFGQDQIEALMGNLEDEDIIFADYLQETVQGYREILNERNIEITGRDLGFVENYWPASSEHHVNVLDDMKIQGETPSALKERVKGKVIPIPRDAWLKAQKHIAEAEHVKHLSRQHEKLKRLFSNRTVKHTIKQKFGDDVYDVLMDQIDNISLNAQVAKIDAISGLFRRAINNWVTAKIALNPSTLVRQLVSVGNFAENMNSVDWVKGFAKGIASPLKTFNFMWNNAPFLEARFNRGYSEAVKDAIEGAEKLNTTWSSWTKFLTSLGRVGDITAIIYGGFPLVKSELAKGKTMKESIETFEKATLKAQQSGLSSSLSQFQNSRNPFARLFLAFKNTANQYFRKMGDAIISFQNGDI